MHFRFGIIVRNLEDFPLNTGSVKNLFFQRVASRARVIGRRRRSAPPLPTARANTWCQSCASFLFLETLLHSHAVNAPTVNCFSLET